MDYRFSVSEKLKTGGNGYWSTQKKLVKVTYCELENCFYDRKSYFGHLKIYFKGWNTETDGLIYTDSTFLREFRHVLQANLGFQKEQHLP